MRVPITGGAGFLGLAPANYLADAAHHVRVLDDLSAGHRALLQPDVTFEGPSSGKVLICEAGNGGSIILKSSGRDDAGSVAGP
jgi:UDP-glucose 4-epimerase